MRTVKANISFILLLLLFGVFLHLAGLESAVFIVVLLLIGFLLRLAAMESVESTKARHCCPEGDKRAPAQIPTRVEFPRDTARALSAFVIYVSLPAMILVKIPQLPFSPDLLTPMLMPWGILVLSAVIVWYVAKWRAWPDDVRGSLLLLVPLGNTSFLGIPMVEAYFGSGGVPYALVYDQVGTFLALATYGSWVVALPVTRPENGNADGVVDIGDKKAPVRLVLKKVFMFPPFLALILGLLLALANKVWSWSYPPEIGAMLEVLAATLIPLVIIAVGFEIVIEWPTEIGPLGFGLAVKLGIAPLVALGICYAFDLHTEAARVAVLEAGMPSQISAWALAMTFGLATRLSTQMVAIGIILSFGTLWVLFQFL